MWRQRYQRWQGDADRIGLARREQSYLWSDAFVFHVERWFLDPRRQLYLDDRKYNSQRGNGII
jgi:hypothetical protein